MSQLGENKTTQGTHSDLGQMKSFHISGIDPQILLADNQTVINMQDFLGYLAKYFYTRRLLIQW